MVCLCPYIACGMNYENAPNVSFAIQEISACRLFFPHIDPNLGANCNHNDFISI